MQTQLKLMAKYAKKNLNAAEMKIIFNMANLKCGKGNNFIFSEITKKWEKPTLYEKNSKTNLQK
jgi:hypothetical protein